MVTVFNQTGSELFPANRVSSVKRYVVASESTTAERAAEEIQTQGNSGLIGSPDSASSRLMRTPDSCTNGKGTSSTRAVRAPQKDCGF